MQQVRPGSRIPLLGVLIGVLASGCAPPGPTVEEAQTFVEAAETRLLEVWIDAERAAWVQSNFITDDTTAMAADAQTAVIGATMALASEAARFDGVELPEDIRRKLLLLKTSMGLAAPADPALQAELAGITTSMESAYGKGVYCPGDGEDCLDLHRSNGGSPTAGTPTSCSTSGPGGALSRRRCYRSMRGSRSWPTPARPISGSPTLASCGGRATTCRRTI